MDSGTPGSPILHYSRSLLRFMSVELVMLSNQLILATPFSFCLQSLPASESFPMSWLFTSGGQIIGASASAPVLPMNIQGWFPLGLTCLISLQSKGLSRVFLNTTVQKHFLALSSRKWQPTSVFLLGKSHGLWDLVGYSPWGQKELDTTELLHFPL